MLSFKKTWLKGFKIIWKKFLCVDIRVKSWSVKFLDTFFWLISSMGDFSFVCLHSSQSSSDFTELEILNQYLIIYM
jgi:hypothetical protein